MFKKIDNLPGGAIGFLASGRVTREDRARVLEPTIATALGDGRPIRLLYIVGSDFAGYDPGGLLDDSVFGTHHFRDFERIAFLAEEGPYRRAVDAVDGLMPAALRIFPVGAVDDAKAWLAE